MPVAQGRWRLIPTPICSNREHGLLGLLGGGVCGDAASRAGGVVWRRCPVWRSVADHRCHLAPRSRRHCWLWLWFGTPGGTRSRDRAPVKGVHEDHWRCSPRGVPLRVEHCVDHRFELLLFGERGEPLAVFLSAFSSSRACRASRCQLSRGRVRYSSRSDWPAAIINSTSSSTIAALLPFRVSVIALASLQVVESVGAVRPVPAARHAHRSTRPARRAHPE
jgi:hypothetical protein